MSKIDTVCAWALAIANDAAHGYDQGNRWGPDYDCSALVISAWEQAGVPVKSRGATYTGNMRGVFLRCGFEDVTSAVDFATGVGLERGDVLLNVQSHTALYIGGGRIVHASLNENRQTTGGMTGDQTGAEICTRSYYNYPWNVVLRYRESGAAKPDKPTQTAPEVIDGVYTVQKGDTLWGIASKLLGSGDKYRELQKLNGLASTLIYVGQRLKIPGQSEQAEDKQSAPVNPPETADDAAEYTVVRGDTLWSIAQRYLGKGTRYKEIMEANGLKSEMIRPGQVLKIPK